MPYQVGILPQSCGRLAISELLFYTIHELILAHMNISGMVR